MYNQNLASNLLYLVPVWLHWGSNIAQFGPLHTTKWTKRLTLTQNFSFFQQTYNPPIWPVLLHWIPGCKVEAFSIPMVYYNIKFMAPTGLQSCQKEIVYACYLSPFPQLAIPDIVTYLWPLDPYNLNIDIIIYTLLENRDPQLNSTVLDYKIPGPYKVWQLSQAHEVILYICSAIPVVRIYICMWY